MPHPIRAFLYDNDAHQELLHRRPDAPPHAARGLVGRQVASSEFFDAWLRHGTWDRTVALIRSDESRDTLARRFHAHIAATRSKQVLQIVALRNFHERFFPDPPATLLHLPHPLDPDFAWARHHVGPHSEANDRGAAYRILGASD